MDDKIAIALKKAAQLIRNGETKQAQRLLVAVLKEEPKLEQAWYMLSFVVDDERVEYVLSQVLAINPQNENAIKRLQKWQQEKAGVQEEEEETDAESDIEPAEALDEETFEEQAEEVEEPEEDDEVSKRLDNYGVEDVRREITQQRDEYLKSVPENFMDGEDFTDRKKRSPLLIVFLVLVVLGAVFAGLYFFTDIFKPAETPITEASPTFEIVEEETPTATVILPTKTATLVPSPTATLQPTSTHTPTSTPTTVIFPTPVIALSDILTELDSQVLGFREFESPIVPEKYVLSQYDALNYFNAYEIDVNVEEQLDLTQKVLVVLNLVSEDYDMLTSYYNRLGLLSSVNNSDLNRITVFGIPFGIEQQFSYVYSFFAAQLTSMVEESTGITPGICFWLDQECQAITGLVWGDAFFSSELWAETYLTDEDKASISRIDRRDTILLDLNTPNSLFTDAQFGFDYGRLFAQDLYNISLWWTQLEGAYQTTPTTTEQLMHLNKYLSEEEPVEILDPDLTEALEFEWEELWSGSLGEWYTFLLMRHSEDAAYDLSDADLDDLFLGAAEGWGGDNMQIYQNPAGRNVIVGHWALDTVIDTEEFLDAISIYQTARFTGDPPQLDTLGGACWQDDLYVSCVFTSEQEVLWVYTPGEDLMFDIMELFEEFD